VVGQHSHVDDMEVPASVADDPAHGDRAILRLVEDMACGPTSGQGRRRLISAPGRQARPQP
jgi:hypothetical protein